MKKLLIIALVVLFIAPFAYAEKDLQVSGWYKTNGTYWQNHALRNDNTEESADYDQDMEFTVKAMASETTGFTARIEIHDMAWKDPDGGDDEDITVERAWGHHLFTTTNTKLDIGLMTGGTWGGVAFADDASDRYRVKLTQPFSEDFILVGLLEKYTENKSDVDGDRDYDSEGNSIDLGTADEGDDGDNYAMGAIIKAGDIAIKPLFYFINANTPGPGDLDRYLVDLAITGNFGAIGFESEFAYNDYKVDMTDSSDPDADDYKWKTYGAYLNAWANIDTTKVGAMVAYGSWTDDKDVAPNANGLAAGLRGKGFDFDDDFDSTIILADEFEYGNQQMMDATTIADSNDGLYGMTLLKLYASIAMGDITLSPAISYVMSNQKDFVDADGNSIDDSNIYEGARAWEVDFVMNYQVTDVFSYYAQFAYAQMSFDNDIMDELDIDDPDAVYQVKHGIKIVF